MEHIKKILKDNLIGTAATINEDGSPWATPVHILSDDNAIYWYSKDTHQHSQNVQRDPRVSVSLWSRNEGTNGAYIQGVAERLEGPEAEQAFDLGRMPNGNLPPVFENTSPYRVKIGELNRGKSSENRWYFYT